MASKPNSVADLLQRAAALRPVLAERLGGDLGAFVRAAWRVLHPGRRLVWSWHYDLLCEYLALVRQRKVLRMILNVPPRTAKTTVVSLCFPCWCWASDPEIAFLCASHSMDLSVEHNVLRRNLLLSSWYQGLWGDRFHLASDRNLVTEFVNDHRGGMIATSVGARTLGKGGDIAILDDPMSADQALSDAERKTANLWLHHTLLPRLNDPPTSPVVLVMQRLHELDSTGFFLEQEPGVWTHVRVPLVAEEDERWLFPISGRVVERQRGDVLQPDRFPKQTVEQLQARRFVYAGQYQQRPVPLEGNLIKRADVRYYGGRDPVTGQADEVLPTSFDLKLLSVDCAFKDLATSDYVAILVLGVKGRKRYILNCINAHLDAAATESEIRRQHATQSPISAVLVEDKANGPAVVQRLRTNVSGVVEVNPQGGKTARLFAAQPEWQAGDWLVNRNAAWVEPFVEQVTMVPGAAHDDMADAMSQAAIWLQQHCYSSGLFQLWAEEAEEVKERKAREEAEARSGAQPQEEKDRLFRRTGRMAPTQQPQPAQAPACPNCGNKYLTAYADGFLRCGPCGWQGQRDVGRQATERTSFRF
jgi:predicted phage terminase large subunit-like protein